MNTYTHRIPKVLRWFYPDIIYESKNTTNEIYITFDDGPNPEFTEFVLEQLFLYQAKASFFCLGENIEKNPNSFKKLVEQGHSIGNHTYSHLNGWKSSSESYIQDVEKCENVIFDNIGASTRIFRPPYGRIKPSQFQKLKGTHRIFLWSYLTGDFDHKLDKEECLARAKLNVGSGDIVVFHDNEKSYDTLKFVLPKFLQYYHTLGFEFKAL